MAKLSDVQSRFLDEATAGDYALRDSVWGKVYRFAGGRSYKTGTLRSLLKRGFMQAMGTPDGQVYCITEAGRDAVGANPPVRYAPVTRIVEASYKAVSLEGSW